MLQVKCQRGIGLRRETGGLKNNRIGGEAAGNRVTGGYTKGI